jgi:hypothetical protein
MALVWMPPRKRKIEDMLYPQMRHWLVDEAGRILACVIDPQPDDQEDSFDGRLYFRSTDDEAYFISLEHAKDWCEQETGAHLQKQRAVKQDLAAQGVVQTVLQEKT